MPDKVHYEYKSRPATRDDADKISDLLERCYYTLLTPDHPQDAIKKALPSITRAHLTKRQQKQKGYSHLVEPETDVFYNGTYYVIPSPEDDNVIIGSGGWMRYCDYESSDKEETSGNMYPDENGQYHVILRFLATDPDWVKKGVASHIWERCLNDWGCSMKDQAKDDSTQSNNNNNNTQVPVVWHCTSSLSAPEFYKKLGFHTVEHIEHEIDADTTLPCVEMELTTHGTQVYNIGS